MKILFTNFFKFFFFLLLLTACSKSKTENSPLVKLRIAFAKQPEVALVHIAYAKGFFAEEGLLIEPINVEYGKQALNKVLEDKADIATLSETPLMFSILNDKKVFLLANIAFSNSNNSIIARRDSGITKLSDLKGKRIGFTPGTSGDFFLSSALTSVGLNSKDIIMVKAEPNEMEAMIVAKKIDAVSTWNYSLTLIANRLGKDAVMMRDKDIYTETFNLVAKENFTQKNPLIIEKLLRALIKAESFAQKNTIEAQQIVATQTNVDLALVKSVWSFFSLRIVLDETLLLALEDACRWAIGSHMTDKNEVPNFLKYIYFDAMEKVRPESIKIKRR